MSGSEGMASAGHVLERCLSGEVPEANSLSQLLHLYRSSPRSVLAALSDKANIVVTNADAGALATRAATLLINAARFLDDRSGDAGADGGAPGAASASSNGEEGALVKASVGARAPLNVRKALLEHVLLLTGGQTRAAKETAIRAQGCALLAAFAAAVPDHCGAEAKLIEFAIDRVPSIREKAVRGLAALSGAAAERALVGRTGDPCTAVRASAVRGLRVSKGTISALLERIDDVDACVRAQLFHCLADQPAAVQDFCPAFLARLLVGLADRSSSVRAAAGAAVDAWHKHLGGTLPLLNRCDVTSDEMLSEAAARMLVAHFSGEGVAVARMWLGRGKKSVDGWGPAAALLARLAVASMNEEERDENIDVPLLLRRVRDALDAIQRRDTSARSQEYLLRQLLHIVAITDICDEGQRRQVERLAEAVLLQAPVESGSKEADAEGSGSGASRPAHAQGAVDLGVVMLRKCYGLGQGSDLAQTARGQALEARCSTRVVLLLSDLCQPLDTSGTGAGDKCPGDGSFTTRLSLKLQEVNTALEERVQHRNGLLAQKKKAVADEDFKEAHKAKEALRKADAELKDLRLKRDRLKGDRDSICLRVLAVISALLRWSNSDLRRDQALFGTLDQIVRPMVSLPALSEEVEMAAVSAICLFCVRDATIARGHWSLLMELLRSLRNCKEAGQNKRHLRARAAVAARTLADCARIHGHGDSLSSMRNCLDRDEVLSAASALAAVPVASRQVVLEPLCGWLLSLGHVFFEEHLREPVLEVQWALGWLIVEAFKQRRRLCDGENEGDGAEGFGAAEKESRVHTNSKVSKTRAEGGGSQAGESEREEDDDDEDSVEAMAAAAKLMQFFTLLPKLPGKHGAPMLSLAVESVAESGLWRRAALLPSTVGGQTRWVRGFSWPSLFAFAHERLPVEMRFRLWRCSLQLCVTSPALAPLAEIPMALAAAAGAAPAGAAELLQQALALGADADALGTLAARLPPMPEQAASKGRLLLPRAEAEAVERERRAELLELGVEVSDWAPADFEAPDAVPFHHKMRKCRGGALKAAEKEKNTIPVPPPAGCLPPAPPAAEPSSSSSQPDAKRRRQIDWGSKLEAEVRLPIREA